MKRSTQNSAFVLITILSNRNYDKGLAGESRAASALKPPRFNFQFPSSFDVKPTERSGHILYCTQIGRSFEHLNDYPGYYELAKDDFGFMSPCGPVHGMVRGYGRT